MTASDGTTSECVTDANGNSTASVKVGETYTLVGSVSGYERTVTVQRDTTSIKAMPDGKIIYWCGRNTEYASWKTAPYINSEYKNVWLWEATTPKVISDNNCIHIRVQESGKGGIYYCTKQVDLSSYTRLNCIYDISLGETTSANAAGYNAGFVLNPNTYYSDSDSVYINDFLGSVGSRRVNRGRNISKTGNFYPFIEVAGPVLITDKHLKLYAMWLE